MESVIIVEGAARRVWRGSYASALAFASRRVRLGLDCRAILGGAS